MATSKSDRCDPLMAARILATILLRANAKGQLNFMSNEIEKVFGERLHENILDDYLEYFKSQRLFQLDWCDRSCRHEEDVHCYRVEIWDEAKDYFLQVSIPKIQKKISDLNSEISRLESEKEQLLTFDPNNLSVKIAETRIGIQSIQTEVESSELLSTLEKPLEELLDYINRIEKVNNVYSEIYLNIIKPIKKESEAGIRVTAKWAIIAIFAAAIITHGGILLKFFLNSLYWFLSFFNQ